VKLIIASGPLTGTEWTVVEADSSIGRDPSCDFVLPDEALSRQHCRLVRSPDGWMLIDLDSTNGVKVNGKSQVHPRLLKHGDKLELGQFTVLVETDPNRPLPRPLPTPANSVAPAVATTEKDDPWLFGMVVFAAALAVVATSLFFSMTNPTPPTPVATTPQPTPSRPATTLRAEPEAVTPSARPPAIVAVEPVRPIQPRPGSKLPKPPRQIADLVDIQAVKPTICPECRIELAQSSPLPVIGASGTEVAESPPQPATQPVPPQATNVYEQLIPTVTQETSPSPTPRPNRDTLETEHLLRYSRALPLAEADAATIVRDFDRHWHKALIQRPLLDTDPEVARQRRLKAKALALTADRIAQLEHSAAMELRFSNNPDCWQPEKMPSPPVMSNWVPTRGLQGKARVMHDGLPYELAVRHEVKGYDYGYYEPGRHLIYRLTVTLNDMTLLQKVYDIRSIPQPPTSGVLGPHDLPVRVQRNAANSLFRFYAQDCTAILAPLAKVQANAKRDPIPVNYISRIPASAWDYRTLTISWRRNTGPTQWQRLIHEAIDETFAAEFDGFAAQ
jgi:predicted component of type VI protein secretion system